MPRVIVILLTQQQSKLPDPSLTQIPRLAGHANSSNLHVCFPAHGASKWPTSITSYNKIFWLCGAVDTNTLGLKEKVRPRDSWAKVSQILPLFFFSTGFLIICGPTRHVRPLRKSVVVLTTTLQWPSTEQCFEHSVPWTRKWHSRPVHRRTYKD